MSPAVQERAGELVRNNEWEIPFSYFPVDEGGEIYDSLFATSPWAVMSGQISTELEGNERIEALAFLEQARQFYATAGAYSSANPLLYYYAFLNLAKPLIRLRGFEGSLEHAKHGLYPERVEGGGDENGSDPFRVVVEGPPDSKSVEEGGHPKRISVFAELGRSLGSGDPRVGPRKVADLMSQIVIGHRLWRQASGSEELFLGLEKVEMRQDKPSSRVWLQLLAKRESLTRFRLTPEDVIERAGLMGSFQEVTGYGVGSDMVGFEQLEPLDYQVQAIHRLNDLANEVRDQLWRIVSADADQGYRKYYLHISPTRTTRLPQLLSMFHFHYGSMVRYQPHVYAEMTQGRYGAFVQEFVAAQPEQMLYLLASEMCRREVAKPAIA